MKTILGIGGTLLLLWFLYQNDRNSVFENKLEKLEKNIELLTTESKSQVPENSYVLKIGGKTIGPILLIDIPKHLVDIQNTLVWDNEKLIWKHIFVVDEIVKFCQIKKYPLNWSPKNLDVDKFRNGDIIPEAKTNEEWKLAGKTGKPAWCYYDNNPENGKEYGKLYNWFAVTDPRGLAPKGFHIPTSQEWKNLEDVLGEDPGKKLKSNYGWEDVENGVREIQKNGNGIDLIGFNALPGGNRDGFYGSFNYLRNVAFFWCADVYDYDYDYDGAVADRYLSKYSSKVNTTSSIDYGLSKSSGASVRCIRD
jgi:uncharacterized protein (TIGR02145 family)